MNEREHFNPKLLKALFRQLVKAVGGNEACGVELQVSHQRISQLANVQNAEMARELPTWDQVWRLESVLGRSIVFAGLAHSVDPVCNGAEACATTEAHQLLQAVAALCPLAAAFDRDDHQTITAFNEGVARVQRELADVQAIGAKAQTLKAVS